jgi:hypothetical protein
MPTISTDPVSSLASALPARAVVAIVLVAGIVAILCYMSPLCLTRAFVTTIGDAVKTYIEAQGAGLLSEVEVQMLHVCVYDVPSCVVYLFKFTVDQPSSQRLHHH